jgi:alkanesulfonate monooxygenase SsuD/methylene tetrahydromethanopterin reductase-like flavin-dependent oxidoreductase (luciferase family)
MPFPTRFGVFYDFRNPAPWRQPWQERYRQLFEQIDWVEGTAAFQEISVSEHHFVDDGYTPSVLAMAAAIATRTRRVGLSTNILQLPLHHPLRIAEDSLTVDALSDGRFRLGVAVGYRPLEFEGFGTSPRHRGSRMDEAVAILRLAFAGEPFAFEGRHWSFPELEVTPGPVRPGGPPIWFGGTAPVALARAARSGDGFMASVDQEVVDYRLARAQAGKDPAAPGVASRTAWMIVDPDPAEALRRLGPYMLYQVNKYVDFGFLKVDRYTDPAALVRDGFYTVTDAVGAMDVLGAAGDAGVDEVHFFAVLPGEPVESGTRRLDYLANEVIARLPH